MIGIQTVKPGKTLGDVGYAIQSHAEKNGFSVVRDFTGHGLGTVFHTSPTVLHYGEPKTGLIIKEGMFFTIERMINAEKHDVKKYIDDYNVFLTHNWSYLCQKKKTIPLVNL